MGEAELRDRIERYYASVPLHFADSEDFGSLRLFVRKQPGAPYYGGPNHAQPAVAGEAEVAPEDVARVRARQRELGVPEAFEWLAEIVPGLRARMEADGRRVAERRLLVLPPDRPLPAPLPTDGVTVRALDADDPALPSALAVPLLAFGNGGAAPAAIAEQLVADGTVEIVRATMRAGHKTVVAALAPDGTALAAGQYHPAEGTTEIGGVGTLSTARRQGLGAAVTAGLAAHAREHGVRTVFLAYAEERVARIYARLGFRPAGSTLLIADQPARM